MTTATTTQTSEVRIAGRGRKPTAKTFRARRAVLAAIRKSEGAMTTKEIAKATKQSKVAVGVALRWAESQGMVTRKEETARHEGRGRPMTVWSI